MKLFFKKVNKLKKAFTLIETLVAISIFTVSLLGIMSVLASSISSTNYAKQKMIATYLAQEGVEYARNLRDTEVITNGGPNGWSAFIPSSSSPSETIVFPYTLDPDFAGFSRLITKNRISADEANISSAVTWNQGSGPHTITFSENLFNWVR